MAKTRVLGVDYGLARIGLALSDEGKILASPLTTFRCAKRFEETLQLFVQRIREEEIARSFTVEEIVVGLPLHMDGRHGILAEEVKQFVQKLQELMQVPIILWDERLTSVQAERAMREASLSRKKRSGRVDQVAAVLILQNYLDSRSQVC